MENIDAQPQSGAPDSKAAIPATARRRGRQKGCGRVPGSGRKAGQPNHLTRDQRTLIVTKGKPVEFLCKIVAGQRIRLGATPLPGEQAAYAYPSLAQRIEVALALAGKVVPDLKELSGPDGKPLAGATVINAQICIETAGRVALEALVSRLGVALPVIEQSKGEPA